MACDLGAKGAEVCETSLTRHRREREKMKKQHCKAGCDNSLRNGKWPPDYLPMSSLAVLGSVAMRILAPQGSGGDSESCENFDGARINHWGPREGG